MSAEEREVKHHARESGSAPAAAPRSGCTTAFTESPPVWVQAGPQRKKEAIPAALGRPAGREEKSEPGGEPRARSPIYSFRTADVFSDLTGTWDPRSPGAAAAPRLEKITFEAEFYTERVEP